MAGSSRSRRQRTKTKHYTDDDPSTFTTKEKKGSVESADVDLREKGRASGRGRGRESGSPSPLEALTGTPAKKRPRPRKVPSSIPPPPSPYTCIDHYVRIAPIFHHVEPPHSVIDGRGLGVPQPLKLPTWQLLPQPEAPEISALESESFIKGQDLVPSRSCTSSCTAMASNDIYLVVGDTGGVVSVYTLAPKLMVVTRLTTSASIREALEEVALPPSRKFGLYQKKNHPNQIEKIGIANTKYSPSDAQTAHRLVVATKQELELLDMYANTILWTFPLEISIHALDIHPLTHQVLCSFVSDMKNDSQQYQPNRKNSSQNTPLCLMDYLDESLCQTFIQPITNDEEPLQLGNRCSAVWDKSNVEYLIMVTLVWRPDDVLEQELLQLHRSTFTIRQRLVIPNKPIGKSASFTIEFISQSPIGHVTLVSSTKGIQFIDTATFQILRVFGEAVALHGHSLLFQQACYVPKPKTPHVGNVMTILSEQRDSLRLEDDNNDEEDNAWIVGVPFANREPREFCNVLHLWDCTLMDRRGGSSKNTNKQQVATTIAAPPKACGFIRVECLSNLLPSTTMRIVITTQSGQLFSMSPTLKSDFGGIMYPPGYQVVNDNLEYIEDEDDVDLVMTNEGMAQESYSYDVNEDDVDTIVDDDVAEALRLSMLEAGLPPSNQQLVLRQDNEIVDVVSGTELKVAYIPCRPERYLKYDLRGGGSSPLASSTTTMAVGHCVDNCLSKSFADSMLLPLAHCQEAVTCKQATDLSQFLEHNKAATTTTTSTTTIQPKLVRVKRTKAASLEALLKSSLDMDLRRVMMSRQVWANGSGSRLEHPQDTFKTASAEEEGDGAKGESQVTEASNTFKSNPPASMESSHSVVVTPSADETIQKEQKQESDFSNETTSLPTDIERAKLDVAAALLMSANGELDSPGPSEHRSTCESNPPTDTEPVYDAREFNSRSTNESSNPCRACRGRFVYHTCTKKDRPVDYEELERADKERKEKEEDEKRKAKIEKRRLADAKRREARKKKKLEEEDARNRLEELDRLRREIENRQQEVENARVHSDDKDRRRADM